LVKLSKTQQKVLELLPLMEISQVAKQMEISDNTVYQHLKAIRKKYREARGFVNLMDSKYRSKSRLRQYLWTKEFG
jgi:predicted ArsR family transcriptional regulator